MNVNCWPTSSHHEMCLVVSWANEPWHTVEWWSRRELYLLLLPAHYGILGSGDTEPRTLVSNVWLVQDQGWSSVEALFCKTMDELNFLLLLSPESARTVLNIVNIAPRLSEKNSHPSLSPRLAQAVHLPPKCGVHFPTSLIHIGW